MTLRRERNLQHEPRAERTGAILLIEPNRFTQRQDSPMTPEIRTEEPIPMSRNATLCGAAALIAGVACAIALRSEENRAPGLARTDNRLLGPVFSPSFSLDGSRLLIARGKAACLWDLRTGTELRRFEGHADSVCAVAFSPDGRYVLTGGGRTAEIGDLFEDNTARLWDLASGKEIRRFGGTRCTCTPSSSVRTVSESLRQPAIRRPGCGTSVRGSNS